MPHIFEKQQPRLYYYQKALNFFYLSCHHFDQHYCLNVLTQIQPIQAYIILVKSMKKFQQQSLSSQMQRGFQVFGEVRPTAKICNMNMNISFVAIQQLSTWYNLYVPSVLMPLHLSHYNSTSYLVLTFTITKTCLYRATSPDQTGLIQRMFILTNYQMLM